MMLKLLQRRGEKREAIAGRVEVVAFSNSRFG